MNTIFRRCMIAVLLGGAILALHAVPAQKAAAADNNKKDAKDTFRERTIYIPYEKLRKVFEAKGRGVFLPYEEFQELWKAAREKRKPPVDDQSPVGALISEVESDATVSGDVMRFKAKLKIELLRKGWHKIPLRLGNAAITAATIDGKPARLIPDRRHGHLLLVERGEKPVEPIELKLEFAKAINRVPGRNEVSVEVPQAPVSRWRITIPEPGVKVDIHPLLAASEVPDSDKPEKDAPPKKDDDKTVVLAFVGAAPTVSIAWTPKTEGATGLTALATVQAQQQVRISEGVMRTQVQLSYTISRAKLSALAIAVPAHQKVINVFDANVRQWSVAKKDGSQNVDVQLFEPAEGRQNLTIELEQFHNQTDQTTLDVPVVEALGVGRQQGIVVVQVAPTLRAETKRREGLLQVDAAELPRSLARGKWDFAYRYASVPFDLKLSVEKVKPRVAVDTLVEVNLSPTRLTQCVTALYNIERTGIFRLEWDVPKGYHIHEVRGANIRGAQAARVDTHYLSGEKKTRLVVNLERQAIGRTGLFIRLEKNLDCPELLTPPERPANIEVAIPRVVGDAIEEDYGRLLVRSPESLRVNPAEQKGLRPISFEEALRSMPPAAQSKNAQLRPMFAFAFARDPVELKLSAERRKPQTTVGQLLTMKIEDDTIHYEAVFTCNVLYSGVKSLRIDVPVSIADKLRNQTPAIREQVVDPAPDDVSEGYQAWQFSGETELLGRHTIKLVWEDKLDKLGLGEQVPIEIPRLVPCKADDAPIDRAWGQIVLGKAETIDLRPAGAPDGLRGIDPRHDLMDKAQVAGAASAFEFHGPWSLTVTATRYELQDIKRTIIENAVVRMVVTRSDAVAVQALYRLQSAQQRLEVSLPPGVVFDSEPLRINGRPVTLERGSANRFFVPLVDSSANAPLLLDLRYTMPGRDASAKRGSDATSDDPAGYRTAAPQGGGSVLVLPEFPENPAIQKVHLCVYLPEEKALIGTKGPWTNEIRWRQDNSLNLWKPTHRESDAELIETLKRNIEMQSDPTDGFQTDGYRYVFSTLRPTGPLELVKVDERTLTAVVLVLVVLVGLLLIGASIKTRALAVGTLITVVILCGMFAPLFARQVLDGYFLAALALVAVVWIVAFVLRHKPQPKPPTAPPQPATKEQPPETTPPKPDSSAAEEKAEEKEESPVKQENDSPSDEAAEKPKNEGGKSNA